MSKFRSLFVLRLTAFLITILSCISVYSIEYKDIQAVREKEGNKAAFTLLKQLAEQGDSYAQFNLGVMYDKGEGTTKNYIQAFNWYKKAAEQGNAQAQCNLGNMYRYGIGIPKNYMQAFNWFKMAAEQGNAQAQCNLGVMHNDGLGTPKNYVEAYKWYSIAAASDSSSEDKVSAPARALMNNCESKMTPEQIATAQNLAKEWVETH